MTLHSQRRRRALAVVGAVVALVAGAGIQGGGGLAQAAPPTSTTDEAAVPHYFGPWPNWANSPLTLSKASVQITDPSGSGSGAAATADVDPKTGGISGITVTSPGHDYGSDTTVTIIGGSAEATGTPTINATGVVTGFDNIVGGSGYSAFEVKLTGGGGGTGATATGSGKVDSVDITDGGSGYTMPTVDINLPDDPNGTPARGHVPMIANGDTEEGMDANGTITKVVIDEPGSGYATAPDIVIRNGTIFDPVNLPDGGKVATATTTLALSSVDVADFGTGFTISPSVTITDPKGSGTGASAKAVTNFGAITSISLTDAGAGFLTKGMRKFIDGLPGTCTPGDATNNCPTDGKFIPNAVPTPKKYGEINSDEYVIGLVQYRTSFSSDIPQGTLVRGYVQIETPENASISQHVPLTNELLDGTKVPVLDAGGQPVLGVTAPQYLGPFIGATKNKPVRIVFHNYLPTGGDGDLFLPTDSTMMGSGMGPMDMAAPKDDKTVTDEVRNPACTATAPKSADCFKDNRATLHLHGGITPWISDGTPHQWITPATEQTDWPEGVSVQNVPDMTDGNGATVCAAKDDGCETFYYTNQQSARLMFYHDHSWGITRLNVYAGEAAGYTITDDTEKKLVADGTIPGADSTIPLVIQDKTFVPSDGQMYDVKDTSGATTSYGQDPTWDKNRWGGPGSLWYHHVYMTAQNPGDPTGMSPYGRWMYGPWFWPPAADTVYGPIPNPYYDVACKLDDPSTWQYQTDPYCEPKEIPGTPNVSAGMEQFNDTPIVNGVAYPKVTLQPKAYRLRMLNAANDRFFNLQWYVADPTQGDGTTEVALKRVELDAAQIDPTVSPTPVGANDNAAGPDWVQIANEGGFLPAPTVIDGQQPTTYIVDPTRFDVGNVDKHSMLIAPAERADAVVDFSKFAGKTLILYNDAPAAFPARVPQYDYYTGAPDLSPAGAPTTLPGYGPNTRTVMQVKIEAANPAPAFNLTKLQNAFKHNVSGTGVFESGQHPAIVGQAAYNSAYGTGFAGASDCNAPGTSVTRCDGLVRVHDTTTFSFNTLRAQNAKMTMHLEPKAIHDEMNATTFDEYGRMEANLGIEAQPPTPGLQNVTLFPYVNPATELIDGTKLPKAPVAYDANGNPEKDVKVTPIGDAADGTQIWRFTHNGVDTHPIHFHLYDVQVINRVTWDNIIIPTEPNELGWKDTVRMSPLEDTIVALRPIIPQVPFEVPNSVRELNPMMPNGSTMGFNNFDPQGNPTAPIQNKLVNFGWEYVFHCHILSHEEMDMMRPVSVALPPVNPDGLTAKLSGSGPAVEITWHDNSITETSTDIQRSTDGTTWTSVGTLPSPLSDANTKGPRTWTDTTAAADTPYLYRVVALNTVGYGAEFPSMTVKSQPSNTAGVNPPAAPANLAATILGGPPLQVQLTWTDNAKNESGFTVERAGTDGKFSVIATLPANSGTGGTVTYGDQTVTAGSTYTYKVTATNLAGSSAPAEVTVAVVVPGDPTGLTGTATWVNSMTETFTATWTDNATNESGYTIQWSTDPAFGTVTGSADLGADATTFTAPNVARTTWYVRVQATNAVGASAWSNVATIAPATGGPVLNPPATPTRLTATLGSGPRVQLAWTDNATNETGYRVERATGNGAFSVIATLPARRGIGGVSYTDRTVRLGYEYSYRVTAFNADGTATSGTVTVLVAVPPAPTGLTGTAARQNTRSERITLTWKDVAGETGYTIQWSTTPNFARISGSANVGANVTTYRTPTISRTTWYVRVRANNVVGSSAWTATTVKIAP